MQLEVWDISLIEWSHKRVCLVRVAQTKTVAKFVSSDLEQIDTCGRRKHTISYLSVYDKLTYHCSAFITYVDVGRIM